MHKYQAILLTLDALDHQFDYSGDTIEACWRNYNNAGSKWIFYPIPLIIKYPRKNDNQRIVEACYGLEHLQGKSIKTAKRWITDNQDYIKSMVKNWL